jgi:hypothetical protein
MGIPGQKPVGYGKTPNRGVCVCHGCKPMPDMDLDAQSPPPKKKKKTWCGALGTNSVT